MTQQLNQESVLDSLCLGEVCLLFVNITQIHIKATICQQIVVLLYTESIRKYQEIIHKISRVNYFTLILVGLKMFANT